MPSGDTSLLGSSRPPSAHSINGPVEACCTRGLLLDELSDCPSTPPKQVFNHQKRTSPLLASLALGKGFHIVLRPDPWQIPSPFKRRGCLQISGSVPPSTDHGNDTCLSVGDYIVNVRSLKSSSNPASQRRAITGSSLAAAVHRNVFQQLSLGSTRPSANRNDWAACLQEAFTLQS